MRSTMLTNFKQCSKKSIGSLMLHHLALLVLAHLPLLNTGGFVPCAEIHSRAREGDQDML